MPLSEEELRLLEQMERALAAEDPKFVSALQGRSLQRVARLRMVGAGVVFIAGIALLLGGAVAQMTWIGIVGFVIMLASATLGLSAWRGRQAPPDRAGGNNSDALFDFNDNGHPFRVVQGGRAAKGPKGAKGPKRARRQARAKHPSNGTFMQRMEQRWQRRRDRGF